MIPTIIFIATFVILYYLFACKVGKYLRYKEQQNNDLAVKNRNKAILYGLLCIIFVIALLANRDEFINVKHSNCSIMKENQMQIYASGTTKNDGSLEPGAFYLKLPKT